MAGKFKNDAYAEELYSRDVYKDIPKSVFALVAFYLAQRTGDDFTTEGALAEVAREIQALGDNGIISPGQATTARRAFTAANKK